MGWTVFTVSIKIGPIFVEGFILYVAPPMRRSALQLLGGRMSLVWTCLILYYGLLAYCEHLLFRYIVQDVGNLKLCWVDTSTAGTVGAAVPALFPFAPCLDSVVRGCRQPGCVLSIVVSCCGWSAEAL